MGDGGVRVAARLGLLLALALALASMVGTTSEEPPTARLRQSAAGTGPPGFADTLVHTLSTPTAVAWTPDGRMLITQDAGAVRVSQNGTLLATPALNLGPRMCADGERGLLGIAVDPDFAMNHFIYLYWTNNAHGTCGITTTSPPENRVTRHVLGDDNKVVPGSETILIDHIRSEARNHNAGDLNFGSDQLLYVSVGDGGCTLGDHTMCGPQNTNSRRLDIPHGKILRVDRDGAIPPSNPYVGAEGARRCAQASGPEPGAGPCLETYASGFRNPFRFAQVPGTSTFHVNDVGQSSWEEIDRLVAGKDYGWNVREGHCETGSTTSCEPTVYENPIHDYSHAATGCGSITGGAFVPDGVWPEPYSGSYLFADYVCGKIFRLVPGADGTYTQEPFMTGMGAPVHLAFGPHGGTGALYYLDYGVGEVRRVTYGATNTPPTASFTQRPDGLTVLLDGSASHDPDTGDAVRGWIWVFGDGTTQTTTGPKVTHTYPAAGDYPASLRVTDSHGATSLVFRRTVFAGEHPPTVSITAPAATARFSVGQKVTIQAAATDPEDGALPPGAFTWTVQIQHGTHRHPYAGPQTGSSITVTYPAPEDLASTENSYLVATAVAKDSRGLTSKAVLKLLPKKVALSFATAPSGGRVLINGGSRLTPYRVISWPGYVIQVSAPNQSIGGVSYVFRSWSDGGARTHSIVSPGVATTYTASFARP